jgi:hypothetical protein
MEKTGMVPLEASGISEADLRFAVNLGSRTRSSWYEVFADSKMGMSEDPCYPVTVKRLFRCSFSRY